jgi:hypothetical protein
MAAFHVRGIDAHLAWHGDADTYALVFVPADPENLARLEGWIGTQIGTRQHGTRGD